MNDQIKAAYKQLQRGVITQDEFYAKLIDIVGEVAHVNKDGVEEKFIMTTEQAEMFFMGWQIYHMSQ